MLGYNEIKIKLQPYLAGAAGLIFLLIFVFVGGIIGENLIDRKKLSESWFFIPKSFR